MTRTARSTSIAIALFLTAGSCAQAAAQAAVVLPFEVGEELGFRVRSSRFGQIGKATMCVKGPELVHGVPTYILSFDLSGRVLLARIRDRTRSWIEPGPMISHRYTKDESSPIASHREAVDLYPGERRWQLADGSGGETPSDQPLDELSFLYFIRTLPLLKGDTYAFDRHFDAARNPVHVRVIGREEISVPAGRFSTVVVEMRVKQVRRFGGNGVLKMHLTDDDRRIPIRIATSMPVAGVLVLDLEAAAGTQ